jgi:hypothetical protein
MGRRKIIKTEEQKKTERQKRNKTYYENNKDKLRQANLEHYYRVSGRRDHDCDDGLSERI